jgi:outer membrane protein TolC
MRKIFLLNLMLCCGVVASAQLSINDCYAKARDNYPLIKQYGLIEKSKDYNLSNADKAYMPQVSLSFKASYQSKVTEIPVDIPGVKGMNKDQYGATVDVNQVIWDGGVVKSKKEIIRTASEVEKKRLEVDLYSINERVNQLYFGLLLFEARLEQNRLFMKELGQTYDMVASCVHNGIAHQADLDAVKLEQLKARQAKSQLTCLRNAYLDMLSAMIGEQLDERHVLLKPAPVAFADLAIRRPEVALFDSKIKNMEAQNREINAGLMPKLGVFLTGGYGNPGLNMLQSGFSGYYVVGARLSWNLSGLYTNKNSKQLIQNNIDAVLAQQETFLFTTNLDVLRKQREIDNYREQMKYDDEIIALRASIKQSAEAKMANGALSGIDLMREVSAEELAKQDKILHEIELLQAMYSLKLTIDN